ncbi:PEP/pyruvate-binding domain-containing protein [Pseudonocardia humida]|uniref:Phosphoenolpyruvate synthase n=1 Tax=Pseudonocardia humida TaxID=2800819 RepID=A0ABT0ZYB6_9PSEU|nr:PEP/pyruvate-binding domain-containing protein [Pseudonocardia humida]MCO1655742.1 phosphoenolpyruvate synthase [Pseudonocardia humida]
MTVVGLDSPAARSPELVGGKAANLAELLSAGFAVPTGFCVVTDAYREAACAAGLDAVVARERDAELARHARDALLRAPVPPAVAEAVSAAYAGLGDDVPVAVRSSATAEDLPTASFAGQQDTYLNVVGTGAVLDAVRRCWASLWTDRAVAYRDTAGIDQRTVALAVVVQRMVDARSAGVLFTADPVSGGRTRTVLDASPGLGEAVVSGAVNPDHVVVDGPADTAAVDYRPGDKAVEIRALPGGGTERVERAGAAHERTLTDAQVRELVALGRRVEAYYGSPQDIEWAYDGGGRAWLTQSRPITTLHPVPPPTGPGLRAYLNLSLAQGLTRPITPLGISAFRVIGAVGSRLAFGFPAEEPTGPVAMTVAGGRVFVDMTAALRNPVGRRLLPLVLGVMEARSAVVVRALLERPEYAAGSRSPLPFARRVARALVRFAVPVQIARALVSPAAARRRIDRIGARLTDGLPAADTAAARHERALELLRRVFPVLPSVVPAAGAGFVMLGAARRLAGPDIDAHTTHELLRSLPHNVTTEMDLELWRIAERLRADEASAARLSAGTGPLPPVLRRELDGFLREHGHRAVAEIDAGMPRWRDDPAYVLGVLANYLRLQDPAAAPDAVFARGTAAALATLDDVVARVRRRSPVRARLVGWALRRMRELAGLRETHKDYLVRLLAAARVELGAVGDELAGRGLLDAADDVWFLDLAEVRGAVDGADHRSVVAERRAEYDRELRRRHVPRILLSDGTEPEALLTPTAVEGALVGTAASAGEVTGPARVVLDPADTHLEPGEILVAPSTDPGWTPLFLTAGGLVMEMGGSNSHGAVVAREYGIPAVVGVPDATAAIRTGQRITVDGAAGLVRLG